MPSDNHFHHQQYGVSPDPARVRCMHAAIVPPPGDPSFQSRMRQVGRCFRRAGVTAIYLIHGTFVGADSWGLIREVGRLVPDLEPRLRAIHKRAIDHVARETGNYTQEFAETLQAGLELPGERPLPVRRLHWSSENHHAGRAHGAVKLLDALCGETSVTPGRFLLWGHSHGGNVLALLTNLLGGDCSSVEAFFRAAAAFYRWPLWGKVDLPVWQRVYESLTGGEPLRERLQLDIVTFGTPVRYGWDVGGYQGLVHFIHHRAATGGGPLFPPTLDDVLHAAHGDLMQLLGVAGTNFLPPLWEWRTRLANRRLGRLLQRGLYRRQLWKRLCAGQRTHEDGMNVLVDYGEEFGPLHQHLAGHAVYTRRKWMLFHAEEAARQLYGFAPASDNVKLDR